MNIRPLGPPQPRRAHIGSALALALALVGLARAGAQAPPAEPPLSAAADSEARARNRLLHTIGGTWIRGRCRRVADRWEIRQHHEWQALPPGSVVEVKLESEVLSELKTRRKRARREGVAGQTGLADWMVQAGLWKEAFAEIDAVLKQDPDRREVLALLSSLEHLVALPDIDRMQDEEQPSPHAALLKLGASASPSIRELAVARLAASPHPARLRRDLDRELRAGASGQRAFAALALRRVFPGEALRPLLVHAVLDPSEDTRLAASLALGHAQAEAVVLPVVRALGSSSSTVRSRAAQTLGWMGYPAAVEPLVRQLASLRGGSRPAAPASGVIFVGSQHAFLQDFDVEVAEGASIAAPLVGTVQEGVTLDVRISGVHRGSSGPSEARAIREALQRLTGANPGRSAASWKHWWDQSGASWRPSPPK